MVVFVFVVRRVELYDDADCICCRCALLGNLSFGVVQSSCKIVPFPKRVSSSLP